MQTFSKHYEFTETSLVTKINHKFSAIFQVYIIIILFNKIQVQTQYRNTCP